MCVQIFSGTLRSDFVCSVINSADSFTRILADFQLISVFWVRFWCIDLKLRIFTVPGKWEIALYKYFRFLSAIIFICTTVESIMFFAWYCCRIRIKVYRKNFCVSDIIACWLAGVILLLKFERPIFPENFLQIHSSQVCPNIVQTNTMPVILFTQKCAILLYPNI